jgi:hypothetical protein
MNTAERTSTVAPWLLAITAMNPAAASETTVSAQRVPIWHFGESDPYRRTFQERSPLPIAPAIIQPREPVARELLVGELRRRGLLEDNWDGENGLAPSADAMRDAIAFARLLGADTEAEPMTHAKGTVGLFWKSLGSYADIEFLGGRRIAYYIERNGDKHKGVVNFDSNNIPAVFANLLPT